MVNKTYTFQFVVFISEQVLSSKNILPYNKSSSWGRIKSRFWGHTQIVTH